MKLDDLGKKELTFLQISTCVLQLEILKGHLKWKVTDLEKKSDISRSLIYRYLGNSKEEILKNSLQIFTFEFYGFGTRKEITFVDRIGLTREFLIRAPEVIQFYQKWRMSISWIQNEFISIEEKFQKNLKKLFAHLSDQEIMTLHSCLHGLVTAPFLSTKQTVKAAALLEQKFNLK